MILVFFKINLFVIQNSPGIMYDKFLQRIVNIFRNMRRVQNKPFQNIKEFDGRASLELTVPCMHRACACLYSL